MSSQMIKRLVGWLVGWYKGDKGWVYCLVPETPPKGNSKGIKPSFLNCYTGSSLPAWDSLLNHPCVTFWTHRVPNKYLVGFMISQTLLGYLMPKSVFFHEQLYCFKKLIIIIYK